MEFAKVLRRRASVRSFTNQMPKEEDIRKMVDAVLLGPIVRRHQLHLTVVTDRSLMTMAERAADEFNHREEAGSYLYGAPVWIILSGRKYSDGPAEIDLLWNNNLYWNMGSLIEVMELQAADLGLAGCAVNTVIVAMKDRPDIRAALEIPEGYDALASYVFGYAEEEVQEREIDPERIPVTYKQ